ncbi:ABC transporter ATP-binding protein [Nocardioides daejeonensis]|uniref:ABC transporter ATP-binding protein n=1 Tax=Nocardioides daejeonensis TaxID=1046556 RepID=UPI0013A5729A|nr:ATP-binding cassette domain-containing protein [Nocardioides daejeonensis]
MTETEPLVLLDGISRSFGDNVALDDVTVDLRPGEVHALVGENGAGKSTLMKVLAGHITADAGRLEFERAEASVDHAGPRAGVGFVEQEGGLIRELTGAENLVLAERSGFLARRSSAGARIREMGRRFGGEVDPDVPVETLAVGQRQRLEIMIVLARGAKVLILDEPTAALGIEDAAMLTEIIRRFIADGGAVFYISHKLQEVLNIADRVTVLRRGRVTGRHDADRVSVVELAADMVGQMVSGDGVRSSGTGDLIEVAIGQRARQTLTTDRTPICTLRGVQAAAPYVGESALSGLDLTVRAGEVVGVAGVVGSGQSTLARVLAGLVPVSAGELTAPAGAIAYIPEHRHDDGVAVDLSIRDNVVVHCHRRAEFQRGPWFRRERIDEHVREILTRSRVHGGSPEIPVSGLSGGNQQKLVLGRELDENPDLVVAHNPFRGLDVRAIQDVREAVLGACDRGAGVVMISPDLDELLQLSHRIVVLFSGRIVGEVQVGEDDLDVIGQLMGGVA